LRQWCEDINRVQSNVTYDFVYMDEESFDKYKPTSFRQLLDGFREYKEKQQQADPPGASIPARFIAEREFLVVTTPPPVHNQQSM
jgi:hypothetical protein